MGNVYGVLKIVLYMKKLGLLGLAKVELGEDVNRSPSTTS
jgi:hypothetical protein